MEGEREGEKHPCARDTSIGCLSHAPSWGPARNPACALTGNQTSQPLVRRPVLNPLSYTSQGSLVDSCMDPVRGSNPQPW